MDGQETVSGFLKTRRALPARTLGLPFSTLPASLFAEQELKDGILAARDPLE